MGLRQKSSNVNESSQESSSNIPSGTWNLRGIIGCDDGSDQEMMKKEHLRQEGVLEDGFATTVLTMGTAS